MGDCNSRGSYPTTAECDLKAYDKLPAKLRQALQESVFDWASQPFLTNVRRGLSVNKLIKQLRTDEHTAMVKDRARIWRDKDRP
jgi:hypothetical protein